MPDSDFYAVSFTDCFCSIDAHYFGNKKDSDTQQVYLLKVVYERTKTDFGSNARL